MKIKYFSGISRENHGKRFMKMLTNFRKAWQYFPKSPSYFLTTFNEILWEEILNNWGNNRKFEEIL